MKRKKESLMNQVFKALQETSRCWDGEEGASGSSGSSESTPGEGKDTSIAGEGPSSVDYTGAKQLVVEGKEKPDFTPIEKYMGSKKVNPEGRPLKEFVRTGMTRKQIDAYIQAAGAEAFLTDEEIAAAAKPASSEKGKAAEDDKKETDRKDENYDTDANDDDDVKDFVKQTGISKKEFASLPQSIQEKLEKYYQKHAEISSTHKELSESHGKLTTDINTLRNDPVVAARLEELINGKAYVAREVTKITPNEVAQLQAMTPQDAAKHLDALIKQRAIEAVAHERAVIDRVVFRKNEEAKAQDVLKGLGQIDKRLSVKESDWNKIDKNHSEYKQVQEIIKFCEDQKLTLEQIQKLGPEKLYKLIATDKGWDKERDNHMVENVKRSLFEKMRNPQKARTLDSGKSTTDAELGSSPAALSRESLIASIAEGDFASYQTALRAADAQGDRRKIAQLREIFRLGVAKQNSKAA